MIKKKRAKEIKLHLSLGRRTINYIVIALQGTQRPLAFLATAFTAVPGLQMLLFSCCCWFIGRVSAAVDEINMGNTVIHNISSE